METDRQIDLCSEHPKRPASVPGLGWCKGPIGGIGSGGQWWKSPVTDLPGAMAASPAPMRTARRRGQLRPWTTQVLMSFAANGDGFTGASRRGSVRDLLIRGIAYRIQEIQHGGLGKSTRRKLKTLAKMFRTEGRVAPDPGLSLKPGARLVREWHGRTHTVTVTEDGFEYGGRMYPSLTKIAKKITGAHWSGPRFFGLVRAIAPHRHA